MDQSKYKKELDVLESESAEADEIKSAVDILLHQGESLEFQLVAEYILSYEPDTRWGMENPLEPFIPLLYEKAVEELEKPGINENQNLIEALEVINHFKMYKIEDSKLLAFIEKNRDDENLKCYSVKCLCNSLDKYENPINNEYVFSLFNEEVQKSIRGEKSLCVKFIIELFVHKNNEQGLIWLSQLANSDQTEFDVKYYLFFNVYGRSSSEVLKEKLRVQCQEFITESWNKYPERYNLISSVEYHFSKEK